MDEIEYRSKLALLFQEWTENLRKDTHAALDGAVDPAQYFNEENAPRILFVLKEMNGSFWVPSSLVDFLKEENTRGATWNNVVRWTRIIRSSYAKANDPRMLRFDEQPPIDRAARVNEMGSVAVMNLKKTVGTGDSHMPTIDQHAYRYGVLLGRQFTLLDPDVVVACGVRLTDIKGLGDVKLLPQNWATHMVGGKKRTFIRSYHPQARGKDRSSFDAMVRMCTEAFSQRS